MTREGTNGSRCGPDRAPGQLTIPDSGHHLMIDQPLVLAIAVDALVVSWAEAAGHDTTTHDPRRTLWTPRPEREEDEA